MSELINLTQRNSYMRYKDYWVIFDMSPGLHCGIHVDDDAALEFTKLQPEVAALVEALRFYASARRYDVSERYSGGEFVGLNYGEAVIDRGDRARSALAPFEEAPDA